MNNLKVKNILFVFGVMVILTQTILDMVFPQKYLWQILAYTIVRLSLLIGGFIFIHKKLFDTPLGKLFFKTLNLAGVYNGTIISQYTDDKGKHIEKRVLVQIHQFSATSFSINMEYKDVDGTLSSSSTSKDCQLIKLPDDRWKFSYSYTNQPNTFYDKQVLQIHDGYTELIFSPAGISASGFYYNYQNRSNGTIQITKTKEPSGKGV